MKNVDNNVFEFFNAKKQEKKRQLECSKFQISEIKAHLQRSRNTCLMDIDNRSFYHGPIAI